MSEPEVPADTEAQQIIKELNRQNEKLGQLVDGYNAIGMNLQWLVDNTKGLFQMFQSPAFMSQMGAMLSGGHPEEAPSSEGDENNG